jgi:hypothetical protein
MSVPEGEVPDSLGPTIDRKGAKILLSMRVMGNVGHKLPPMHTYKPV